jgi:hypothetical protein
VISAVFKAVAPSARVAGGFDSHALPPLMQQGLTRTDDSEQKQNIVAQTGAQSSTAPSVTPDATQQSCASSIHSPDKLPHEKCAAGVQIFSGANPVKTGASVDVPADVQKIVNAWPSLPEHIRAAILAIVGTVKP